MAQLESVKGLNLEKIETFAQLTEQAATQWGNKTGLIFDQYNEILTFHDIHKQSNRIANVLLKLGVKQGDKVALMMDNRPAFPLTWLALGKIGAMMVPINIYYKEDETHYLLENAEVSVVLSTAKYVPMLKRIKAKLDHLQQIIAVDDCDEEGVLQLSTLSQDVDGSNPDVPVYGETLVNIQYTSGSTGRPKGCLLTHKYWLTIAKTNIVDATPYISDEDIMLTAQPFYYMDPQWNLITSLAAGAPLVVLDRFHPSTFWEKVRKYNVTYFYCVGVMPVLLLKMPPSKEDRNNRVRHIACSAIPPNLHKELEERWGAPWFENYGMTEIGAAICVKDEIYDELVGSGSLGTVNQNREIRIVDNNGVPVPRGQIGELIIRGTGIMEGYYKNPKANEEAFRNGFFYTGDLAYQDEKGFVYFVGRKKEMIKRSGENIAPTEVEDVIKSFPDVKFTAVVPVPDEIRGEEVKAYVVLKNAPESKDDVVQKLIQHCEERLAYFKVPRYWEFRDDLPKTPSEKVAKQKLITEKEDLRTNSYDRVDGKWR